MRSNNGHKKWICFLLIAGMILAGCRSGRGIISDESSHEKLPAHARYSELMAGRRHGFKTLKIKRIDASVDINGVRESGKANVAVLRDSLIVISVIPALGFEALRILCSRDSVIIIDRVERSYMTGSYAQFQKRYGIPFSFLDLQAIFGNEVFYFPQETGQYRTEIRLNSGPKYDMHRRETYDQERMTSLQTIKINREELLLEQIHINDYRERRAMELIYGTFEESGRNMFPLEVELSIKWNHRFLHMALTYGQIVFDESLNVTFAAPGQYKRVDVLP